MPVHASVSGTVTAIAPKPHTNGTDVLSVVIKNDQKDILDKTMTACSKPEHLSAEELFGIIREAGIIGMGGAAFPTDRKAQSAVGKADTLIINGCECEPYITSDDMVIKTWPEKVVGGIQLLARALQPQRVVFAIEDNKKQAAEIIKKVLRNQDGNNKAQSSCPQSEQFHGSIELAVLPTRYPQGGEKQLVQAVTGREIPAGRLPADAGCVVFNVSTAYAVYQAVWEGMPLIQRVVTVTGDGINHPRNYLVPIGTSFADLIHVAGNLKEGCDRVIAGGPMMGKAQASLEVPVVKNTGSILCLMSSYSGSRPAKKAAGSGWSLLMAKVDFDDPLINNKMCIRCGKCVQVCPMKLQPLYLYRYGKAGNIEQLDNYHLLDCIECGCCSYTCPGKLPLTEQFRIDKKVLREGRK